MKKLLARAGVVLGAGLGAMALAAPAQADVSGDSSGFTVSVHLNVSSGGGDPVPSAGTTISVPAKCYWGPTTNFDGTDPEAFWKYYKESLPFLQGSETAAGYYSFPEGSQIEDIAKQEKHGDGDFTWYQLNCRDGVNGAKEGYTTSRWTTPDSYGAELGGQPVPVGYAVFPAAQPPPPPLVDVKDVTESLWDVASADLGQATMGRNPTIAAHDDATLVNLPTWFWVTNPVESLAQDGVIDITASIPGSPVRTHLHAETGDVAITSDAGSTECGPEQVQQAYTSGASDAGACTISFDRARPAGWDVRTLISWTGTWDGADNNGPQGGDLAPVTLISDTNVPVQESQALVNSADGDGNP
ncbi:MAG: hypothetical protein HOQ45_18795 [Nocardioidaceae bacterium]|nr:hypothetical protein [Nocardioidaceae bacterium]